MAILSFALLPAEFSYKKKKKRKENCHFSCLVALFLFFSSLRLFPTCKGYCDAVTFVRLAAEEKTDSFHPRSKRNL